MFGEVFDNLAPQLGSKSFLKVFETKECHLVEKHNDLLTKQSWVKTYLANQIKKKTLYETCPLPGGIHVPMIP